MITINLRGREIPLVYTTFEMLTIQEEIAKPLNVAMKIILGRNPDDDTDMSRFGTPEHLQAAAKLIRILGNCGLEEAGMDADLTDKMVMRALKPAKLAEAVNLCMDAIGVGMETEFEDKKPEGPVDVTLEEMNKKKEKGS